MGTYALQVISEVTGKAEFLRFLSPMKWGNAADVITGSIQAPYMALMLLTNLAAVAGSFAAFRRKDILT